MFVAIIRQQEVYRVCKAYKVCKVCKDNLACRVLPVKQPKGVNKVCKA